MRHPLHPAVAAALVGLILGSFASWGAEPGREARVGTELPMVEVPRWSVHEFTARGPARVSNPFRDAAWVGEFVSPSGTSRIVDGFHDGDDTWKLRFAPDEEGEWRFQLRGEGVEILQRGRLRCTPERRHGFIRVHPENPFAFAHGDGTPYFPMGDTCYGLFDDTPITPELRAEYLRVRRAQRFNFVRLTVGHSPARAAADPAYWAWGGTAAEPDLDRFNPEFFRRFDGLVDQLGAAGMNLELILLNFYQAPFNDIRAWTPERERQWLRYLLARYGALDHVFLWTLANEYETHPDGRYRLDRPDDLVWARTTARFIKDHDPFRHLVTVHPVVAASASGPSPRDSFDPPWSIGAFFGEGDAFDVLSQQTSAAYGAQWNAHSGQWIRSCRSERLAEWSSAEWDASLGCWSGDVPGVGRSVAADRVYRKPVLNTEFGYEYRRGGPTENRQVHHTDKVRRSAWRIVCAGGYFAAGFQGTLGHSDVWNRIDPGQDYTFEVHDEGAGAQLAALYDFFAALPYWRLQPFADVTGDALALAEPGRVYVVYLPHGSDTTVSLPDSVSTVSARWFNPRDGGFDAAFEPADTRRPHFRSPDTEDWVLRLDVETKTRR